MYLYLPYHTNYAKSTTSRETKRRCHRRGWRAGRQWFASLCCLFAATAPEAQYRYISRRSKSPIPSLGSPIPFIQVLACSWELQVPEGFRWAGTPAKRYFTFPVPPNGHCTWHGTWVQFTGNPSVPRTKFVAIGGAPQRPSSAAPRTSTGPSSPAARGARPLQAKVTSTLAMSSSVVHQPPARFKACPIPCHRADLVHW